MSGEVAVVGAGTMDAGIAQVCATAGLQLLLVDVGIDQSLGRKSGRGFQVYA